MTEEVKVEGAEAPVDLEKTSAAEELKAAVEEGAKEATKESKPPEPKAPPPTESWAVKKLRERLDKVTAKAKGAEEELARIRASAAKAPEELAEQQIEERARARATELALQMKFNEDTAKVLRAGRSGFPDFDEKVGALRTATLDESDPESAKRYVGLVSGVLETAEGDAAIAAKLIHSLGSDPETAERLLNLSPVGLGRELAKMAERPDPEPPSKAPKPPSVVVGGRSASHTPIDPSDPTRAGQLSMAEWMARRAAQVKERQSLGAKIR